MNNNFNDLGISPPILKAIEEMGFQTPTKVQSRVIPHILDKKDVIVMSKTGSGKTAVFGIPLLQMSDPFALEPQGLILTPTRELAVQIDSDLKQMSAYLKLKTTAVYGQHSMRAEIQSLKEGVSIVTGTPGRVYDHISNGNLKVKNIRYLVLDEADRMLDMGFIDQVFKIIKTLSRDRITLLFSATMPSEIKSISRGYMKNPITVEIESDTKTVDTIVQTYYRVKKNEKRTQLHRLLITETPESCLIFCNTRYAVDNVHRFLSSKGYASQAIHGDIPQSKRLRIMEQFKNGGIHILVATDVAARGIHIDDLALVINYDVPLEKDSYVHRIGRTGRAGKGGRSITLVTDDDIMSLYEIEEHTGSLIKESELPTDTVVEAAREDAEAWIKEKYQNSAMADSGFSKGKHNRSKRSSPYGKDKRRFRQDRETDGAPKEERSEAKKDTRNRKPKESRPDSRNDANGRLPQESRPDSRNDTRSRKSGESYQDSRKDNRSRKSGESRPDTRSGAHSRKPKESRPDTRKDTHSRRPEESQQDSRNGTYIGRPQDSRPETPKKTPHVENKSATESVGKKPFFNRLLQRILGK